MGDLPFLILMAAAIGWALGRIQGHQQGWTECVASWKKNVEPVVRKAGWARGRAGYPLEDTESSSASVLQ